MHANSDSTPDVSQDTNAIPTDPPSHLGVHGSHHQRRRRSIDRRAPNLEPLGDDPYDDCFSGGVRLDNVLAASAPSPVGSLDGRICWSSFLGMAYLFGDYRARARDDCERSDWCVRDCDPLRDAHSVASARAWLLRRMTMRIFSVSLRTWSVTLVTAAACAGPSGDAHKPDSPARDSSAPTVYSSLFLNPESGDLNGTEISVRRLGNVWLATYQESEFGTRCDTLAMSGNGTRFKVSVPPDSANESGPGTDSRGRRVEIISSTEIEGIVARDTLRAAFFRRYPDGRAEHDTVALPRVDKAYSPKCAGASQ